VKPAYDYEKDAAAIYRRSFAVIRGEADLKRFSPIEERVAVRVIHACGMVEAARDLVFRELYRLKVDKVYPSVRGFVAPPDLDALNTFRSGKQ